MTALAIFILISIPTVSVAYDVWFYERRQCRWEADHPGCTYIPW